MILNFFDKLYVRLHPSLGKAADIIASGYRSYKSPAQEAGGQGVQIDIRGTGKIKCPGIVFPDRESAFSSDGRFFILDGALNKIEMDFSDGKILAERDYSPAKLKKLVDCVIRAGLFHAGYLPVHASAVSIAGRGALIAAWPGAGKTRMAMALAANGAEFISDEWCLLKDNVILALRRKILLMDYDIAEFADMARSSYAERLLSALSRNLKKGFWKTALEKSGFVRSSREYEAASIFKDIINESPLEKAYFLQAHKGYSFEDRLIDRDVFVGRISAAYLRENEEVFSQYGLYKIVSCRTSPFLENFMNLYKRSAAAAFAAVSPRTLAIPERLRSNLGGLRKTTLYE